MPKIGLEPLLGIRMQIKPFKKNRVEKGSSLKCIVGSRIVNRRGSLHFVGTISGIYSIR